MDIEWFRDLVICISGLTVTVVLIFVAILSYSLYRKTGSAITSLEATLEATLNERKSTLESIENISATIQGIFGSIEDDIIKPLVGVASLIQGIRQGINAVSGIFKKEDGGENVQ